MPGSVLLNNNEASFSKLAKARDAHDSLSKVQKKRTKGEAEVTSLEHTCARCLVRRGPSGEADATFVPRVHAEFRTGAVRGDGHVQHI